MLSSVLSSPRAIQTNIHIIRVFSKMRELLSEHQDLLSKIEELEVRMEGQEANIIEIFSCLKELLSKDNEVEIEPRKKIGFIQ